MDVTKHFTTSILLWVRTDQSRQKGMDHWKGPHSRIISATPGLEEYRQIHLAETNPGLWPTTPGAETDIPAARKIDGVAEVTFRSAWSPLKGRAQTKLAYQDEVNVFRRTLLYAGPPRSSRWYQVTGPDVTVGARALVYLRRKDGTGGSAFRQLVNNQLAPALVGTRMLKELRSQVFLPWTRKLWDTPNVAHDNPADQRFNASLILGFADEGARAAFFRGPDVERISRLLAPAVSAIHAYDVAATLTFVENGRVLPDGDYSHH